MYKVIVPRGTIIQKATDKGSSLRENSTARSVGGNRTSITVGGIVILKNDSTSRAFWKLGKVEQLIPGKDEKVRAAIVKVSSSNGKNQLQFLLKWERNQNVTPPKNTVTRTATCRSQQFSQPETTPKYSDSKRTVKERTFEHLKGHSQLVHMRSVKTAVKF